MESSCGLLFDFFAIVAMLNPLYDSDFSVVKMSLINISLGCADADVVDVACGEWLAPGADSGFSESAADFLQPITHSAIAITESCDKALVIICYESGFRQAGEAFCL